MLDSENVKFLKTHLDEIKRLFSTNILESTIKKLKDLERARAKRLFS